jgi:multicomponent K+:H+ antiporter subunit A
MSCHRAGCRAGLRLLSAPDLALTQIAVEVVTIILLLLALNLLPRRRQPCRATRDAIVLATRWVA